VINHLLVLDHFGQEFFSNKCLPVRFEVFTAVTMKNAVFCDVTPSGSCKNSKRVAGEVLVFLHSVLRLPGTAIVVPSSPILVTLMIEAIRSSETSVVTRATLCNIPGDGTLLNAYLH
jgi:hypothetical protein